MPAIPWKTLDKIDSRREYLGLLTFLPLRSRWRVPMMLVHTRRIVAQLQQAPGLIGYALYARPWRAQFWTLSVWANEAALQAFIEIGAHATATAALRPHMDATRFVRWRIRGAEVPPSWNDAFARDAQAEAAG